MTRRALTAIAFAAVALLAVVVVVGLAQRTLDPTGVAVVLGSIISAVVVGLNARAGKSGGDRDDP